MSEANYFAKRAREELEAAIRAHDRRARRAHLALSDAYLTRSRETTPMMAGSVDRPFVLRS
jgi:hypothetical protein